MLRRTSIDGRKKRSPERIDGRVMGKPRQDVHACQLCGSGAHSAFSCPVPVDPPLPKEGLIGTIGYAGDHHPAPAKPLAEYKGRGLVIVLPPGVYGDQLEPYRKMAAGARRRKR